MKQYRVMVHVSGYEPIKKTFRSITIALLFLKMLTWAAPGGSTIVSTLVGMKK